MVTFLLINKFYIKKKGYSILQTAIKIVFINFHFMP